MKKFEIDLKMVISPLLITLKSIFFYPKFDKLNQPKPFLTESNPTSKLKSKPSKQPFHQLFKKGSFHLETPINVKYQIPNNQLYLKIKNENLKA